MTNLDLLNKILILVPDAKCSIHELEARQNADDGISLIVELNRFLVVWNASNTNSCPTQDQINVQ